jgi:hypothetical protein
LQELTSSTDEVSTLQGLLDSAQQRVSAAETEVKVQAAKHKSELASMQRHIDESCHRLQQQAASCAEVHCPAGSSAFFAPILHSA